MRLVGLALVLLVAGSWSVDAAPLLQEIESLQRELARVRQEISDPSRSGGLPAGTGADAQVRIQELESQLATIAGRVELMGHTVRQLEGRVERLASDAEMRLSGGTGSAAGIGASSGGQLGTLTQRDLDQAAGQPQTAAVPAARPAGDPAAAYDAAFDLLKRRDYAAADRAFAAFVAAYPKHALAGNALYWQAETHYARSDFTQSAIVFADAYRRYPDSAKAPDIVLKLGLSLAQLGKRTEACQALAGLAKRFPNANPNLLRRAEIERGRLPCG